MTTYYPLADRIPDAPGRQADYRAKATDEYRPPKAGEWYLSGAVIHAYRAPNDLGQSFRIARLVRVERTETFREIES